MKPERHKKEILKLIVLLRDAVMLSFEHGHIKWPPKSLHEVELDIDGLLREIERIEFLKGN